ncbi:MAG: hypothetical protein V4664_03135 [Patescibacteria group bacterium]
MIKAAWFILGLGIVARVGGWLYYDLYGTSEALVVSVGLMRAFFLASIFSFSIWIYLGWKSKIKKRTEVSIYPELMNFIKDQQSKGKREDEIIQLLNMQGGWDIEKINRAFAEINNGSSELVKKEVKESNGFKHFGWGVLVAFVVFLLPLWTDYQEYKNMEGKFFVAQQYYSSGNKIKAIEVLNEITSTKVLPGVTAQAYLTKGVLYRSDHFNDAMAREECIKGLTIDPTIETEGVLNRDKNGNTVADICRMIIDEGNSSSQETTEPRTDTQKIVLSKEDYRLCQAEDVIGDWSRTYSYIKPGLVPDPDDALHEKYQYYFFNDQGKYRWTVSNLAMDKASLSISGMPPLTSVYSVDNGKITMKQETDAYPRSGLCGVAVRDFNFTPGWPVKTNDLIQSFTSNGELIYLVTMERI